MKLPKRDEKFVVNMTYEGEECSFYGFVVSGVHIEIRGDDNDPDFVWYYVYADKVYDDLFHGGCLYVAMCLEHALDFIAQYLAPYKEPEEKAEEGSVVKEETSDDLRGMGNLSEIQKETGAMFIVDDSPVLYGGVYHGLSEIVSNAFGAFRCHLGGVSLA